MLSPHLDLSKVDDHDRLLISEIEAVTLADMAQHLLRQGTDMRLTELHIWPEYATPLAVVISTGLQKLDEDERINK